MKLIFSAGLEWTGVLCCASIKIMIIISPTNTANIWLSHSLDQEVAEVEAPCPPDEARAREASRW